jgi:hypothetical protein
LLGGLAGDAQPGADFGPGVAACPQALDCLGNGGVDLLGQTEHEWVALGSVPELIAAGEIWHAGTLVGLLRLLTAGGRTVSP